MPHISRRAVLGAATVSGCYSSSLPTSAASGFRNHPLEGVQRENIKITDLRVTLFSAPIPSDKYWYNPRTITWKSDGVLLEVFTDKGIIGIGEADPYGGPPEMKEFAETYIRPALIGQNPFDIEMLAGTWASSPHSTVRTAPGVTAWAGVDCALWDIIGKVKGVPVYQLLAAGSRPEPRLRLYASGGNEYAWYKRPEALIDEALKVKEAGFPAFKFRMGSSWGASGITVRKYIPLIRKLREAVGRDLHLIQESNMRLTLEESLELAPVLEELKFMWFEEPCSAWTPDAIDNYRRIRQALPRVMISGGEHRRTRFEFKEWIDRGALDIVQPDCSRTGITEAWQIARMARMRNKLCCPHNWLTGLTIMANAALTAAIPNRLLLEYNNTYSPLKTEIFKEPLVPKRGYLNLPDRPGFGMELCSGLARKFPYLPGSSMRKNPDLPLGNIRPMENW